MRKKTGFVLMVMAVLLLMSGCGKKTSEINGNKIAFDQQYKDSYITYDYPGSLKEVSSDENTYRYPLERRMEYEYYEDDKLAFVLIIEEHDAGISFAPLYDDQEALEKNPDIKNLEHETMKYNGKNFVYYSYNKDDEFGKNTLYHLYYGGYSYAGINEFIKIYFINADDLDDFEKNFMKSFKIKK